MTELDPTIYISYHFDDIDIAIQLYEDLKNVGIKPWIDTKDILPGQNRHLAIRKAIKESQYFLALISKNYVSQRGYINREMKIALDIFKEFASDAIYIIPVSLDGTRAEDETMKSLESVDFLDYSKGLSRILDFFTASGTREKPKGRFDNSSPKEILSRQGNTDTMQMAGYFESIQQLDTFKYNWDDIFVGRESLLDQLFNSQKDSFIFGARRIGKTSLLRHLEKCFSEKEIPAFYISFQGLISSDKIKRKLNLAFRRKNFIVDEKLVNENSFFDFLEELDIPMDASMVILVDEAEQIQRLEQSEPRFMDKLRNFVESSQKIRFIMAASPHFIRIVSEIDPTCSAFLTGFEVHVLSVMTREETCELMQKFVETITYDQMEQILCFTYYQPYLVRIFINKLIRNGKLQSPSKKYAIDAYTANALEGIFPNYFEGLNAEDQIIVREIHKGEFQSEEKYKARLNALVQYGYLKSEAGEYQISNWFFQYWLDCQANKTDNAECGPESTPVPKQADEKKPPEKNNRKSICNFWEFVNRVVLICSLITIFSGSFMSIKEAISGTSWIAKMLGVKSAISDAMVGIGLIVLGVVMFLITIVMFMKKRKYRLPHK